MNSFISDHRLSITGFSKVITMIDYGVTNDTSIRLEKGAYAAPKQPPASGAKITLKHCWRNAVF